MLNFLYVKNAAIIFLEVITGQILEQTFEFSGGYYNSRWLQKVFMERKRKELCFWAPFAKVQDSSNYAHAKEKK